MFVSSKIAAQHFNVSPQTLRRWANTGKINYILTKGRHRKYQLSSTNEHKRNIIYARVSSVKQSSDLQRQISFLQKKYPSFEVVSDISSGVSFKRKGLLTILEQLFAGNIQSIVVYSKDRLARFGFELLEFLFQKFNASIIIYSNTRRLSSNEELAEDILAIITVFTARYYGSRKYRTGIN